MLPDQLLKSSEVVKSEKKPVGTITPYMVSKAEAINISVSDFPFPTTFTFSQLINYWRQQNNQPDSHFYTQAKELEKRLEQAPELMAPIQDFSLLEKYREVVELLISPFFPVHPWVTELKILTRPLESKSVLVSPRLEKLTGKKNFSIYELVNMDKQLILFWQTLYAYKAILARFYHLTLAIEQPIIMALADRQTGLTRYFKLNGYHPFVEINNLHPLPELSRTTFRHLVDHFYDMDLWMEYLPPHYFEFSGFTYYNFLDVTAEEAIARLEHLLLSHHGSISDSIFDQLQQELRILFRLPDIDLGLGVIQRNGALNLRSTKKSWNSLKIGGVKALSPEHIEGSIYGRVMKGEKLLIVEDLADLGQLSKVEQALLKQDVRNIALVPLYYQQRQVGLLEITSPKPGDINPLSLYKLNKITPIFSTGINENLERFEHRVQSVLKAHYTAIHPSVEWRFREAAIEVLDRQRPGEAVEPEAIFFENVYPLYWAADIRDSSKKRNKAIWEDLVENLKLARHLLNSIKESTPLLILAEELDLVLEQRILAIQDGMGPGDETSIVDLIRNEVNPFFDRLYQTYPPLGPFLEDYMPVIRSEAGVLYKSRKAYERSLKLLNETISSRLLTVQEALQEVFPHYFEKYETDGVEYNIYIGDSLVKHRKFDLLYLRNLRLHQLLFSCEIAGVVSRLDVPFEITQLILVHSAPINLRFRLEEKQFEVDGAYNMRYEIIKKRVDKATIKGTKDRITLPGHIAIIYSMDRELEEYSRYIRYLQTKEYITGEPEFLELADLQGVSGLKAIRLKVNLEKRLVASLDLQEVMREV